MSETPSVLIVNGPNLNMLGQREPETYGRATLADVEARCHQHAERLGLAVDFRQSNSEGELVTWIQEARTGQAGIVVNAAAYTHSSIALLDALRAAERPAIEVHLSNPMAREAFRQTSYIAPAVMGTIAGFGAYGYVLALDAMRHRLLN